MFLGSSPVIFQAYTFWVSEWLFIQKHSCCFFIVIDVLENQVGNSSVVHTLHIFSHPRNSREDSDPTFGTVTAIWTGFGNLCLFFPFEFQGTDGFYHSAVQILRLWSLKRRARLYGCHCVASHSEAPVLLCALPVHSQTPRSSIVLSLFLKCYDFELATSADLARSHQRKQTFCGNPKMHTLQHIYLVISLTSLDRVQNFNFAINLFKSTRLFSIE